MDWVAIFVGARRSGSSGSQKRIFDERGFEHAHTVLADEIVLHTVPTRGEKRQLTLVPYIQQVVALPVINPCQITARCEVNESIAPFDGEFSELSVTRLVELRLLGLRYIRCCLSHNKLIPEVRTPPIPCQGEKGKGSSEAVRTAVGTYGTTVGTNSCWCYC